MQPPSNPQPRVRQVDAAIAFSKCTDSASILRYTHESVEALWKAYRFTKSERGAKRGMTTDEEQDLLRVMVVMAASGLDAMTKQLIRDTLAVLVRTNDRAQNSFEKFIARRLRNDNEAQKNAASQLLARVLSRPSPQEQMIEEYISDLTGGSLQSVDALFQVVAALGLSPTTVGVDSKKLQPIFATRNKIIHELDIDLTAKRRNRNIRKQSDMLQKSNTLLDVAARILTGVDEICSKTTEK